MVRAQCPAERIGRLERHIGDVFFRQSRQDIGDLALDDDFDVGIGRIRVGDARQSSVDGVESRYDALRLVLIDEQFDIAQLNRIDEYPFPMPLYEGLFEGDDFVKFLGRNDFVAKGGFPLETRNFGQSKVTTRRVALRGVANAETGS